MIIVGCDNDDFLGFLSGNKAYYIDPFTQDLAPTPREKRKRLGIILKLTCHPQSTESLQNVFLRLYAPFCHWLPALKFLRSQVLNVFKKLPLFHFLSMNKEGTGNKKKN